MSSELDNGQVEWSQKQLPRRNNLHDSWYSYVCTVWGVCLHCLQWLKNIWDVWDGKTDLCSRARSTGAQGCWLNIQLFVLSNRLTGLHGHTQQTHVNIATRVSSIIQLSVTLFICNSLTWQYFAFSRRPPLVSQHSSLPHSISLCLPGGSVHLYILGLK